MLYQAIVEGWLYQYRPGGCFFVPVGLRMHLYLLHTAITRAAVAHPALQRSPLVLLTGMIPAFKPSSILCCANGAP